MLLHTSLAGLSYMHRTVICCPLELEAVTKAMPTSKVSPWTESLWTWQLIDLGCHPTTLLPLQHKNYVACQKLSLFSQTVENLRK